MKFPQSDKMNWQEQFKTMKRWYYRLREHDDFFGQPTSYKEDFFVAFFISSSHFEEWLRKEGLAKKSEIDKLLRINECLRLARAIANLAKHKNLSGKEYRDNTSIVGQKYLVSKGDGPTYMTSRLRIESKGRTFHDPFQIVELCMDAWGQFLISKKLEIPDMPEEHIFQHFIKWEPKLSEKL